MEKQIAKAVVESSALAWATKARKHNDAIVLRPPTSRRRLPTRRSRTISDTESPPTSTRSLTVDRGPSSRSEWPWGFMQDLPSCEDEEILERMSDVVKIFTYECLRRSGIPAEKRARASCKSELILTTNGHLVSKYNQEQQLFTVHAIVDLVSTLSDVVDLVNAGDDGFLRRVFRDDDLIQLHTLATIGEEELNPTDLSDHEMYVPTNCTLKKVLFREKGIFLSHPKEILFLDHIQALSSTSFLRVFKSIDNGNYPTTSRDQIVPRHTHVLGGFLFECTPPKVRVTYYAEHAVYPKQFASSLDTRARLEKFGLAMPTWQHAIPRRTSRRPDKRIAQRHQFREKTCQICEKEFHWFRRTCLCSMCGAAVCSDCSTIESVESPNGLRFQVPVCFSCAVQVRSANDGTSAQNLLQKRYTAPNPQLSPIDDDGDGFSESSIGQYITTAPPPTRFQETIVTKKKCQVCSMPGKANCEVCGFVYCEQCADTEQLNVICHLCSYKSKESDPVVLYEPPLDIPQPPYATSSHPNDTFDDFGFNRETYASTLRSSVVLQDSSFSSVEDLMATFPVRRSNATNLRFSGSSSSAKSSPQTQTPKSLSTDASSSSSADVLDVEAACLDMDNNLAYDALCEKTLVDMECTNAYVILLYKDQFMLKGAAGTSYIPASIPGTCAFCIHTVATASDPFIVPDATVDPRFQDSVRVKGKEAIRFYYGLPLRTKAGLVLGTVCVIDNAPRMRIGRNQKQLMEHFVHEVLKLIHRKTPESQP